MGVCPVVVALLFVLVGGGLTRDAAPGESTRLRNTLTSQGCALQCAGAERGMRSGLTAAHGRDVAVPHSYRPCLAPVPGGSQLPSCLPRSLLPERISQHELLHEVPAVSPGQPGDLVRKIVCKEIIISCLIYLWDVSSLNVHRAI